jgi:carbon-monoxide dehydrogenase small subunit
MTGRLVQVEVNGREVAAEVEPRLLLVHFLRWKAGLAGTRVGCDTTSCGACTVELDGLAVKSCTVLAVQEAFWAAHGLQCGYCTPGLIMAARRLVEEGPEELTDDDIRAAISGNICRCTGYVNVVAAIRMAAESWRERP